MTCSRDCFSDTAGEQFNTKKVGKELQRYRRNGIGATTRMLRDGLASAGLIDGMVLDIGAGFGALTFELLERGVSRATVVEASSAYLAAASDEAARRERTPDVELVRGDFLDVAESVATASVVTLDRVICCYPFYERLLTAALTHAARGFAFSYPRNRWYSQSRRPTRERDAAAPDHLSHVCASPDPDATAGSRRRFRPRRPSSDAHVVCRCFHASAGAAALRRTEPDPDAHATG